MEVIRDTYSYLSSHLATCSLTNNGVIIREGDNAEWKAPTSFDNLGGWRLHEFGHCILTHDIQSEA